MELQLGGLHHVTAVTGDAPRNVAFYTQTLGLRLVKKTVNQDDVSAYHLFYGDEVGHPGTELTFFDWPHAGPNVPGSGTIAAIALRVPDRAALDWWVNRLEQRGVTRGTIEERAGRATLPVVDPEGQHLELVGAKDTEREAPEATPWKNSPVPPEFQIRGLHAVRLSVARGETTIRNLTDTLGFREVAEYTLPRDDASPARLVRVFAVGSGGPGAEIEIEERSDLPYGRVGIGGVHHVAFRAATKEEHRAWRRRVGAAGLGVTPIIDRYYFESIYFREPGGILFEIATDGPGFTADEDAAHLGERLALPPFLEPYRARIEEGLRPIGPPSMPADATTGR
jgi:glyoxalase family protein